MRQKGRRAYVQLWASELAETGDHADHQSIINLITAQGYAEASVWLNTDGVRSYLKDKCIRSWTTKRNEMQRSTVQSSI